jgi:hypothetical protein
MFRHAPLFSKVWISCYRFYLFTSFYAKNVWLYQSYVVREKDLHGVSDNERLATQQFFKEDFPVPKKFSKYSKHIDYHFRGVVFSQCY